MELSFTLGPLRFAIGASRSLSIVGFALSLKYYHSPFSLMLEVQPGLPLDFYMEVGRA